MKRDLADLVFVIHLILKHKVWLRWIAWSVAESSAPRLRGWGLTPTMTGAPGLRTYVAVRQYFFLVSGVK